jgi:hypothetical protein
MLIKNILEGLGRQSFGLALRDRSTRGKEASLTFLVGVHKVGTHSSKIDDWTYRYDRRVANKDLSFRLFKIKNQETTQNLE